MVTKKIYLKSAEEVINILGQQDENLRRIEHKYGVQIFVRQGHASGDFSVVVRGVGKKVDKAICEIEGVRSGSIEPVYEIAKTSHSRSGGVGEGADVAYVTFQGKHIKPRTPTQKKYIETTNKYDLVFGIGPAGTGKTFLAVACALKALHQGKVERVVITRPVVEAGEKLGFLPGDLYEKISPYLKPLYDAFHTMLGPEKFRYFREDETVEIVPLAYMRGRTIDNAFLVLDEAQNTTPEQIKMFLTRLGPNSQAIVTGDVTQIDIENKSKSGLVIAEKILSKVDGISFVHFNESDIVRHSLVKRIIKAYSALEKKV